MSEFHEGQEVEVRVSEDGQIYREWHKAKIIPHVYDSVTAKTPGLYRVQFPDGTSCVFDTAHIQKRTRSYDPICDAVAVHFMDRPTPDWLVEELAQHIQDTIEDWLTSESERIEAAIAKAKETA